MKLQTKSQALRGLGYFFSAAVLAMAVMLLTVYMQPNSFRAMLGAFLSQPLLLLLNLLPVFLLVVLFGALFGNLPWGAALVNLCLCLLSIANRLKVQFRQEAVFPQDLLLLREAGEAVRSYQLPFPAKYVLLMLVMTAALVVLGLFWRRKLPKVRWRFRLPAAGVSALALVLLTATVYSSGSLYYSFACTNSYNVPLTYNEHGLPYSFFFHFTASPVDKPEGFDTETAAAWDSAETGAAEAAPVHVIFVMNEAFSDLTDYPVFTYTEETDPLRFYHSLTEDPHALSGHTVVPNFGGGTSNTEFDVLTGIQTTALSASTTTAFEVVSRNTDSLFRVYGNAGCRTEFLHPGYTWFYNRQNVYGRLGAQTTVFYEDMADKEMKGTWVTDDYVADQIIATFEETAANGDYLFQYVTTVQNHMAYTLDKYGEGYEFPDVETDLTLTEETENMLRVYAEGVRDADAMLEKLVDYFSRSGEPVLLAFFGDHYPNLGSNLNAYYELGDYEDLEYPFQLFSTPYVIWTNDAGAEALDWENAVSSLDLPEDYLSACFFGAAVLELSGLGEATAWTAFLNQLRRELPVDWWDTCYMDGAGNLLTDLNEDQQALLRKWRQWSYYKLRVQNID